ncbi:hypothetical protein PRZ48_011533 [Zasmidium cellare]|uniref:SGNH hydrolase-type esterase domain-containing protein n=1 Tax=Zasmidium cellare TaxID=395010 RepID=A0ABR0E7L3_ZASCE|nr:hypothetical protein PRZ48_011533 [Zasmidium cellare]
MTSNEGYGGFRINQILQELEGDHTIDEKPNLVLIHAGTNDNDFEYTGQFAVNHPVESYADAPNRLGNLIDFVLCHSPDAVVLVAILIQNDYNNTQTNLFNAQVPNIVAARYEKGYKVRVVDMSMIGGSLLKNDILHPNDAGYNEMAQRWYSAMRDVPSSWWSPPGTGGTSDSATAGPVQKCARDAVSFSPAIGGAVVAPGWHLSSDPGEAASTPEKSGNLTTFVPHWGNDGDVAIGSSYAGSGVRFADLNGDGRADYLWVNVSTASFRAWINGGKDVWTVVNNGNELLWGTGEPDYVEFAVLTGSKRADYIGITELSLPSESARIETTYNFLTSMATA